MKTTREEKIIKPGVYDDDDTLYTEDQLKAAIAAEREACALVCETIGNTKANMNATWRNGCRDSATEIRARGETK